MASPTLVQYESETESSSVRIDERILDAGYEVESGDHQEDGFNGTLNLIHVFQIKDLPVLPSRYAFDCLEIDVGLVLPQLEIDIDKFWQFSKIEMPESYYNLSSIAGVIPMSSCCWRVKKRRIFLVKTLISLCRTSLAIWTYCA